MSACRSLQVTKASRAGATPAAGSLDTLKGGLARFQPFHQFRYHIANRAKVSSRTVCVCSFPKRSQLARDVVAYCAIPHIAAHAPSFIQVNHVHSSASAVVSVVFVAVHNIAQEALTNAQKEIAGFHA